MPIQLLRYILHSIALSSREDLAFIASVTNDLIKLTGAWMPKEYVDIDEMTVELAIRQMTVASKGIELKAGAVQFANPFLKAYSLMKSAEEYNDISVQEILRVGGMEC